MAIEIRERKTKQEKQGAGRIGEADQSEPGGQRPGGDQRDDTMGARGGRQEQVKN